MTAVAEPRPRLLAYAMLWLVLPPLALGYQISAEETARGLMGAPFGAAWFMKAAALTSTRWLLAFEIASFVAWMIVLERIKLSQAFPGSALSYVCVILVSWLVYHEHASIWQAVGGAMILAGIWLLGHSEPARS
jgi:multidrug transporter EmrE-like cation transporter